MAAFDSTNSAVGSTVTAPAKGATTGTSGYNASGYRYHTSTLTKVAEITNAGAVNAYVTLSGFDSNPVSVTVSGTKYTIVADSASGTNVLSTSYVGSQNVYTYGNVVGRFTIGLAVYKYDSGNQDETLVTAGTNGYELPAATTSTTYSLYVYAYVIWTTDDSASVSTNSSPDGGVAGDALDTFIGESITSLDWDYTWTAVQGSELPASA